MRKYITLTAVHAIPFLSLFIVVLSPGWGTAAQAALTILVYLAWNRDFTARVEAALARDVEPVRAELDNTRAELALIEPVARRALDDQRALRARVDDVERNLASEAARLITALTGRKRRAGALTEEKERAIVAQRLANKKIAALAEDYNVDERTIQRILKRYRIE